jgi:prepilin-type processing-associated H-X9-DG protein
VVSPESKVMVADSRSIFVDPARLAFANYAGASVGLARNVEKFWPEATPGSEPEIVPQRDARHQMGQNAAFFDGHVKWVSYRTFIGRSAKEATEKWFLYWQ